MMVEVLELDFRGWKCGDIGKRQGEPQDKDTKVGDLRPEWEMARSGWSLTEH